jgi:hypothetical protein
MAMNRTLTQSDAKILILLGVTPRAVEHAYATNFVRTLAAQKNVGAWEIQALAKRWGIDRATAKQTIKLEKQKHYVRTLPV